jgi:hypothetical protein
MIPRIIVLAILTGFSTLIFRIIFSHRPFRLAGFWTQIAVSSLSGVSLWIVLLIILHTTNPITWAERWDVVCGVLIHLCAFWCNYWIGNLGGGFRVQMAINLADQTRPVTLEEWMAAFSGLGLDVFLKDRLNSILIPWKIVSVNDHKITLLPGWGMFFGKLIAILEILLYRMRSS